jgi:hypothetical protein
MLRDNCASLDLHAGSPFTDPYIVLYTAEAGSKHRVGTERMREVCISTNGRAEAANTSKVEPAQTQGHMTKRHYIIILCTTATQYIVGYVTVYP